MGTLTDRDIKAITDSVKIEVRGLLDVHKKEMEASSREARAVAVEAVTGYAWDKRHHVRDTIQWATEQRETHNRRRLAFWGALTVLGVSQTWASVVKFFNHG